MTRKGIGGKQGHFPTGNPNLWYIIKLIRVPCKLIRQAIPVFMYICFVIYLNMCIDDP